mmetsp:Transcript_2379/g.4405  ORF Transcript_2379/g.4405 Transcript_2379/m.4405 type:complete len:96 (-) Transcript_2379:612-899(-)
MIHAHLLSLEGRGSPLSLTNENQTPCVSGDSHFASVKYSGKTRRRSTTNTLYDQKRRFKPDRASPILYQTGICPSAKPSYNETLCTNHSTIRFIR